MRDKLPPAVYEAISRHFRDATKRAEGGWEHASEDEDTLTGDLGGSLRASWSDHIRTNGESWTWRVRYKKFRSHGSGAYEKPSGADGIFEIEVHTRDNQIHSKSILFQAKKRGSYSGLRGQVERMEALAPGGSAVFEYGPEGYRGVSGSEILSVRRGVGANAPWRSLGDFLGGPFLACATGRPGMYFDALRQILVVPDHPARRIALRHRIMAEAHQL